MSREDLDPEALADIELRNRSMRDRSRGSELPVYVPPVLVADWKCRGNCGASVSVTQDALDRLAIFNAELTRKGDAPLDANRIVFCDACKARGMSMAPESNRNKTERLAGVIRKLKASRRPEEERELMLQLDALGHPDTAGLVAAIRARLDAKSIRGKREHGGDT